MKVSEHFFLDENFEHLAQELDGLSDRAIAIVSGALVDDCLKLALTARLCDHKKALDEAFNGPLATFSDKIHMARLLGLIGTRTWSDLNLLRRIRNEAAHATQAFSFDMPSISDRCATLTIPDHNIFQLGHSGMEDGRTMVFVKDVELVQKQPNLRYLATALVASYQFRLLASAGLIKRIEELG